MASSSYHVTHDLSTRRRVFIVGDIHGEFAEVEKELAKVNFDSALDSLISVGDLVDRGPHSAAVFNWIQYDWFLYVLGNHELFPGLYLNREVTTDQVEHWGGRWFLDYSLQELENLVKVLEAAPYAMTIITPKGRRVGITHADCLSDWDNHVAALDKRWARKLSVESRATIKQLMEAQKKRKPFDVEAARVSNIDHVFHGHTVLGKPFTIANRSWIDTGACFGGDLTILDIDEFLGN